MERPLESTLPGPPRPVLIAAACLIVMTIIMAVIGRSRPHSYAADGEVVPVATRSLRFVDALDGSVAVYDARSGAEVGRVAPGTGGFVRGAMRGLARGRHQRGIGAEVPFYLTRWQDGVVTLDDSSTGSHLVLNAFGSTNLEAFQRFLPRPSR
jgi:putative photosynthetic complex assembly protein